MTRQPGFLRKRVLIQPGQYHKMMYSKGNDNDMANIKDRQIQKVPLVNVTGTRNPTNKMKHNNTICDVNVYVEWSARILYENMNRTLYLQVEQEFNTLFGQPSNWGPITLPAHSTGLDVLSTITTANRSNRKILRKIQKNVQKNVKIQRNVKRNIQRDVEEELSSLLSASELADGYVKPQLALEMNRLDFPCKDKSRFLSCDNST